MHALLIIYNFHHNNYMTKNKEDYLTQTINEDEENEKRMKKLNDYIKKELDKHYKKELELTDYYFKKKSKELDDYNNKINKISKLVDQKKLTRDDVISIYEEEKIIAQEELIIGLKNQIQCLEKIIKIYLEESIILKGIVSGKIILID